ncbi:hypothetical protein HA402_001029 [Bradysia odoriphaga]|nr:hypothetical protein HA402_001029 [Bradysia odoriphaga]
MGVKEQPNQFTNKSTDQIIDYIPEKEPLTWMFWKKRRYIVVVLAFFGFFNVYSLRVNLSVAIVAMTENRTIEYANGTYGHEQYFNWTSTEQGLILSAFFYGYILTQLVGGYFGHKLGGNIVFGAGIFSTAVLTLLTPLAAKGGVYVLMAVRVVEGIFEGVTFPCIHSVWSKWAPPHERSRMATISFAGAYAGTVVAMPLSGILASSWGWESLFYFFGAIGVVWFIIWMIVVRESPSKDRFISKDELDYINSSLGNMKKLAPVATPWKAIFTSPALYAICASHFSENWGFYTLITQLPTFLKDTMGYDLNKTGFLSAAPYLAMGILLFVAGYMADIFQVKGWLTTTQVRKYFNCGAFLFQTVFMMLAAYLLHPVWSVVCIIIAVGLGAYAWCGFAVNHLDIAPRHASVLMGITNTLATIPGIVSPTLTGVLVKNKDENEWRIVFYISSGIYLVGCVIYWFWCSGEVQPWAIIEETTNVEDSGHGKGEAEMKEYK